eukprot:403376950
MSCIGFFLIQLLGGITIKNSRCLPNIRIQPILRSVSIPPLIGMILFGFLARNFFGSVVEPFPTKWGAYVRGCTLSFLLVRGGMVLAFKGQGIIVLLMSLVPSTIEALVITAVAYLIFQMPLIVCLCMGFILSAISPSVMVPGLMALSEKGYGKKKGIVSALIASGTFEDIYCIILFSIGKRILFNQASQEVQEDTLNIIKDIFILILQLIAALIIGLTMGTAGIIFNKVENTNTRLQLKATWATFCAIALVFISEEVGLPDAKYVASLFFGYGSFRVWGTDKPNKQLANIWFYLQPVFFGSVGATLLLSQISGNSIIKGIICIVIGTAIRVVIVYFISGAPGKYEYKERLFMSLTWVPKATVQAALAAVILNQSKSMGLSDKYIEYGIIVQTTAIFSIILCAPIGAILISTFGPKYLENENDLPETQERLFEMATKSSEEQLINFQSNENLRELIKDKQQLIK